ncbi:hypothetical protein [Pseudoalteromonas phage H103]|uniref:hypothetical protein n=1 Tax=Pseudoalteromonas phage H103 TaxID=1636200 RepID=UPI0006BCC88D|nr:hypothetical protein AVU31_gp05 [Pseudoalteromonas phage H103]AKA61181.1 hypothetical protein [Pseudoalteromonas phage H103]
MNNVDLTISIAALLAMLSVLVIQGYMFGYLLTRKILEWYDIYKIKKQVPEGLCCCGDMEENHGFGSGHSIVYAIDYDIENAKKWSRG